MEDDFQTRTEVNPNFNQKERKRNRIKREMKDSSVKEVSHDFFNVIYKRDSVVWTMLHAGIRKPEFNKLLKQAENAFSNFAGELTNPICSTLSELNGWIQNYSCKVIVDERSIVDLSAILECSNVVEAYVVTEKNSENLKAVRREPNYYKVFFQPNYHQLFKNVKEQMDKYNVVASKIVPKEGSKETSQKEDEEKTMIFFERIRFPNFMKLSSKEKGKLTSYRVNLYCLSKLDRDKSEMDMSRHRLAEHCKKVFQKDALLIQQYAAYPFNEKEILKFYTKESFFYKCLNNTLRTAKQTQEFFLIGHAFNLMFKSVQTLFQLQFPYSNQQNRNFKVYRGTDLSPSECKYLQRCIGNYIEIQGFVSTSRESDVAEKFTKMRNNNKILEIRFVNIENPDSPYLSQDYGFVDLAKISDFSKEGEILFNALNIFKVLGKELRGQFEYFMLSYGQIFNVLDSKQVEELSAEDQYAYYSYRQLMEQKESLNDIGEAYSRCNEKEKAVQYYQSKTNVAKTDEFVLKKCKALLDSGDPETCLQQLEEHLASTNGQFNLGSTNGQFNLSVTNKANEAQKKKTIQILVSLAEHTSDVALKMDKFQFAENHLQKKIENLKKEQTVSDEWNQSLALGQIDMSVRLIEINSTQMQYRKQYELIQSTEILITSVLEKIKEKKQSLKHNVDLHFILTYLYQMTAQIQPHLAEENVEVNIAKLQKKFCQSEEALKNTISQNEYIRSMVAIRKLDVERRKNSAKGKVAQNNKHMMLLQNHLNDLKDIKDKSVKAEIPKGYQVLAEMAKETNQITSPLEAMHYFEKQQFANQNFYGENDPRTIKSNIQIAQCFRENNSSQQSLDLLKVQYKIKPYKKKENHTVVAKTLYLMGMSYLDLGEYTFALSCFQKGIKVLESTLSKKDFNRSIDKYRIILQLGRSYTYLNKFEPAELNLNVYREFMQFKYKKNHTQIAKVLNYLGLLYLKMSFWDLAKKYLQDSALMYEFIQGSTSIFSAKIHCNTSTIFAYFRKKQQALQLIDKAQSIFNSFYQASDLNTKINPDTHMIYYHYAEVYRLCSDFKEAKLFYSKSMQTKKQLSELKQQMLKATNRRDSLLREDGVPIEFTKMKNEMKDRHQELCRQKQIECMYNINKSDKKLEKLLREMITELDNQILIFDKKEKQFLELKESEASIKSQQKKMLVECKLMHAQVVAALQQQT